MTTPSNLSELLKMRQSAKLTEDNAIVWRRSLDTAIAAAMAKAGVDEGTVSEKLDGKKVSVTYTLNRKVDDDAVKRDWENLLPAVQMAFRFSAEVALKNLKALDGDNLRQALKYITTKPGSPSVKVEEIATEETV